MSSPPKEMPRVKPDMASEDLNNDLAHMAAVVDNDLHRHRKSELL